jgi:YfiH family protein
MKVLKGYSTKKDGSMYLSPDGFVVENIKHRKRYFAGCRLGDNNIIAANLVHGTNIGIVDHTSNGFVSNTDALVTKETGLVLTLTGADCFPVYFEDKKAGIIGLAHCGWRGIVQGIIPKTIDAILGSGGNIDHLFITIGPGICKNHFEIQEKDLDQFASFPEAIVHGEKLSVDLKKIIIAQARQKNIPRKHITDQKECTYCLSEKYFSYRRDKPSYLETQVAYIVRVDAFSKTG